MKPRVSLIQLHWLPDTTLSSKSRPMDGWHSPVPALMLLPPTQLPAIPLARPCISPVIVLMDLHLTRRLRTLAAALVRRALMCSLRASVLGAAGQAVP